MTGPEKLPAEALSWTSNDPNPAASATMPNTSVPFCEKEPVVKNDQLAIATVMSCTGTFDHRVVDGALGAQFMAALKKLIEAPAALLI